MKQVLSKKTSVSATSATFGMGYNCGLGIDVYSVPFVLFKQGKK